MVGMYNSDRLLLDNVLRVYDNIYTEVQNEVSKPRSESEMWKELCF